MQRLRRVAGGLVIAHHIAETVDGSDIVLPLQVIATDLHLLARQMVLRQGQLGLRILGIGRRREPPDHFLQRLESLHGTSLVPPDIRDLFVVADSDHVVGIGRIGAARMQPDEPVGGTDGKVIVVGHVVGKDGHQLRLGGPDRIGVLPFHQIERQRCILIVPGGDLIQTLIVDDLHRGVFGCLGNGLLLRVVGAGSSKQQHHAQQHDAPGRKPVLNRVFHEIYVSRGPVEIKQCAKTGTAFDAHEGDFVKAVPVRPANRDSCHKAGLRSQNAPTSPYRPPRRGTHP